MRDNSFVDFLVIDCDVRFNLRLKCICRGSQGLSWSDWTPDPKPERAKVAPHQACPAMQVSCLFLRNHTPTLLPLPHGDPMYVEEKCLKACHLLENA